MRDLRVSLFRLANYLNHPMLLKARVKKIKEGHVEDLLLIKEKLNCSPNTILDIGAALGEWSKAANFIFPNSLIYNFEPITDSFRKIKEISVDIRKMKTFNFALSDKNGKQTFYLNDFSFSSSLKKMKNIHKKEFPQTANETKIIVETRRFDSLNLNCPPPIFSKVDVQGAELDVLRGFGSSLRNIDYVQLELNFKNFYEQSPSYNEVMDFMYNNGFSHFYQLQVKFSKNTGQILFCDIIFIRN